MESRKYDLMHSVNEMRRSIADFRHNIIEHGEYLFLLEKVWDGITALMFIKDHQNNIIKVNQYFCDIVKIKKEDIEGKNVSDLMKDNEQAARYAQNDLIVIKSGKPKIGIVEKLLDTDIIIRTDKFPFSVDGVRNNHVLGFSVILNDRTHENKHF